MKILNWFKGEAGQELLALSLSRDWELEDLLWAINLAVCSKVIETKEDILELSELLIKLDPWLMNPLVSNSIEFPKAYTTAAGFLSQASNINDQNLEAYKSKLHKLLELRVEFAKQHKPQVAQHILSN
jgi:hypothetical protein